jgi:hypothetical protein
MNIKVPPNIAKRYKIPSMLTPFQLSMYMHLINWKWKNITRKPGYYNGIKYDAILPVDLKEQFYPLYRPLLKDLQNHKFKAHKHFGSHMASSQAACLNLFLPILQDIKTANTIFPKINTQFKELATDYLEGGFQFEFFDKENPLNDHNDAAGTDSDVAIAYYDTTGTLSLWLIEHKLTEDEFNTCGGYKSKGNITKSNCENGSLIMNYHSKCYYDYHCGYKYWDLSDRSQLYELQNNLLNNIKSRNNCPFIDGKNQLWRNQLLGIAIKEKGPFQKVHFSVVRHEDNDELNSTISAYQRILREGEVFSTFTSSDIIHEARLINDKFIKDWEEWYSELYLC